jgi:hypothetical protein
MRTSKPKPAEEHQRLSTIQPPKTPPTLEQIHQRAGEIYAARGGLEGMTLNDWLQAELELKRLLAAGGQHATLKDGVSKLYVRQTPAGDGNAQPCPEHAEVRIESSN